MLNKIHSILTRTGLLAIFLFFMALTGFAQKGNVKANAVSGIQLTNLSSPGDLNFGTVFQNQGLVQIVLDDPNMVVFSIEGEPKTSVRVILTAPSDLQLDASNTMPFTLRGAYSNSNSGQINTNQAVVINGNTSTFMMPKAKGQDITSFAYLYLYGDITVGNVNAGLYSGTINVFIEYE